MNLFHRRGSEAEIGATCPVIHITWLLRQSLTGPSVPVKADQSKRELEIHRGRFKQQQQQGVKAICLHVPGPG